jgi:hypothetical protein
VYSDPIHHALAFAAKHFPAPVSRYDGDSGLIKTANVAVILSRYGADESTVAASILKQLVDAAPFTAQATLARQIIGKFGPVVAFAVEGAAEPRFDMTGRERTWKAIRMEYLSRILEAAPSSVDLCVAEEIHRVGAALTAIRRLGVEYLEGAGTPTPEDTLWWLGSLVGTVSTHPSWQRAEMLNELDRLATELAQRIAEG